MKIVINTDFGGFTLSDQEIHEYGKAKGLPDGETIYACEIERNDPVLVALVERMNPSERGSLKVVEIPDGVDWEICEYDGNEWIAEKHRTWN